MAVLDQLKAQHAALLKSLPAHPFSDSSRFTQAPLAMTVVEEEQSDQVDRSPRLTSPSSKQSRRSSITTTMSDSVQWFDALDGPEEFVMDLHVQEGTEPQSQLFTNDTRSAVSQQEDSSMDTDIEDNENPPLSSGEVRRAAGPPGETSAVVRRTQLPASPAGDEGSLFAILKKNVGKVCMALLCSPPSNSIIQDLSTITFPVTFNEPLTLLQRAAEEVEYYGILEQAAESDDLVARFCYVAAFAVSSYAHTRHRSGRKGLSVNFFELVVRFSL
jgi:hypothetical protein